MFFPASLLFGISASLDALLVGTALGLQKIPLPIRYNLLISTVTLLGTVISIGVGDLLLPLFPNGVGTRIGSTVLILFGLYYVGKWLLSRFRYGLHHDNTSRKNREKNPVYKLSLLQALALGCALSLNNIGIGFSASITGLPILPASVSTFFCSFGLLAAGSRLGRSSILQRFGAYADPVSGLLLILLGLCQMSAT